MAVCCHFFFCLLSCSSRLVCRVWAQSLHAFPPSLFLLALVKLPSSSCGTFPMRERVREKGTPLISLQRKLSMKWAVWKRLTGLWRQILNAIHRHVHPTKQRHQGETRASELNVGSLIWFCWPGVLAFRSWCLEGFCNYLLGSYGETWSC